MNRNNLKYEGIDSEMAKRCEEIEEHAKGKKQKRFIVFERPEGSKCWTVACKDDGRMAVYGDMHTAEHWAFFIETEYKGANGMPMKSHIAEVDLPE